MVAGAEPEQRRGLTPEMGQHQFAPCAIRHGDRLAAFGIDQFGVDETAGAQMHAALFLAFPPKRDPDIADAHHLGYPGAPSLLQARSQCGFSAARLPPDEQPPDV